MSSRQSRGRRRPQYSYAELLSDSDDSGEYVPTKSRKRASSTTTSAKAVKVKREKVGDSATPSSSVVGTTDATGEPFESGAPFKLVPNGCVIRLPAGATRAWARG